MYEDCSYVAFPFLEQVELVFLKFGLAQSDEEFETLIRKFLAFTLEKLSSEDGNVRTKVGLPPSTSFPVIILCRLPI